MKKRIEHIGWVALAGTIILVTLACALVNQPEETSVVVSTVAPTEPRSTEPAPTVEPTQPPKLLVDVPGVDEIVLLTPEKGAGVKPEFSWEPLSGASLYTVVLYTPGREPYWAWEGAAASIYLGGSDTAPPEDSAGPVLSAGMWWAVMAFDDENRLVGSSTLRPIAP